MLKRTSKARNIITNGNFALDSNSDGLADNWYFSLEPMDKYIQNGFQYFKPTEGTFAYSLRCGDIGTSRDCFYIAFDAVKISGVVYLAEYFKIGSPTGSTWQFGSTTGFLSAVVYPHQTAIGNRFLAFYGTGHENSAVSNVRFINLTTLFGAGNEPTAEWCDANFPNWFDGCLSKTSMSQMLK